MEKLDVLCGLFHGFDYSKFEGTPAEVFALLPAAANHILGLGDKNEINGKKRFLDAMAAANVAYSLCSTLDGVKELKKELLERHKEGRCMIAQVHEGPGAGGQPLLPGSTWARRTRSAAP